MNILVLCTGNSARSILLEAIFNHQSAGRITAFSAGSRPTGRVNPGATAQLADVGIHLDAPRSKSWDEFALPDAPKMDAVITVCGNARDEECPYWPGAPVQAHWGVEDPADVTEPPEAVAAAFKEAYDILKHRADLLLQTDFEDIDAQALRETLIKIGDSSP